MEEGPVGRAERRGAYWRAFFLVAYCALVVYFLASEGLRTLGLMNLPLAAYFLSRSLVGGALEDVPYWFRRMVYRGWHGQYRAFDDRQVRVLDGAGDTPSRVFAEDIFGILELAPSATELARLKSRYAPDFFLGAGAPAEGKWLFSDAACLAFVRAQLDDQRSARGRTAHRLALWLERSVFMPIDTRRTMATGKDYLFSRGTLAGEDTPR